MCRNGGRERASVLALKAARVHVAELRDRAGTRASLVAAGRVRRRRRALSETDEDEEEEEDAFDLAGRGR